MHGFMVENHARSVFNSIESSDFEGHLFSMRYGGCSASLPTVTRKDAPLSDTSTGKMRCWRVIGL